MKKEPLKNKALKSIHDTIDCDVYKDKDIKSAVEWFKEEIKKIPFYDLYDGIKFKRKPIMDKIDEAFEDVTRKEK